MVLFFFFFSSRRRHTRCSRDWSSDVCSSDLLRNVIHWDADIQSEVELSLSFFWRGFALHLADGAVKHLGVELKSDGFDVAALLSAQEIAGTAQLEIERGDLEARSQIGKLFQRSQPAAGDGRQLNFGRNQEIGISPAVRAAHTPTQLIEFGQTESISPVDQNRVAQWDVEAVLDDRGRHQYVSFVMPEFQHHFFQFAFRHLAVADGDSGARNQFLKLGSDFPYRVHTIVNEIDLAASVELLLEGR